MKRLAFALSLVAAVARAETVVVLPFVVAGADDELSIYGKPVADAVAKVLTDNYKVRALVAGSGQPPKSDLVIELRAARDRRGVRLEAYLRNPDSGERVGAVATERAPLVSLDRAAIDLGHRVGVKLLGALDPPRKKKPPAPSAPTATATAPTATAPPPPRVADTRKAVILYRPSGENIGQAPAAATAAAIALLDRLGFRTLSSDKGWVSFEQSAGDASGAKAVATMTVHIRKLDFDWDGVMTARALVHVLLVSPERKILFDRELATDTVVGGRADGHAAVAKEALLQSMEMARHDLSIALRSH